MDSGLALRSGPPRQAEELISYVRALACPRESSVEFGSP
jgi:hypothetical protein